VTNTRFSPQVIRYARGVKLRLMGWKYPSEDSLESNIEKHRLYPITMLHSLSKRSVRILMENRIVLVKSLAAMTPGMIAKKGELTLKKAKAVHKEAQALCPQAAR